MISEEYIFQVSKLITDYILEPVDQVKYRLAEGYQLFGNPLITYTQDNQYQVLQALIKVKLPIDDTNTRHIDLTEIQKRCLSLLSADFSVSEIADHLHRSIRTVEKILSNLRYRFKCKKNTGLAVKACYLGFINDVMIERK